MFGYKYTKLFLLPLFFTVSCASLHKKPLEELTRELAPTSAKIKGSGTVELLPHQLTPIDYLLKHPSQKGLLVNHYMGTGKTYLGIGFAEAFKDRPVIVLAPKFLESNWKEAIRTYGVGNPDRYTFVSYQAAPAELSAKDLKDHILLVDEAHNLIRYLRSTDSQQNIRYTKLFMNLRHAYKILGLTGTPVYSDESDLAFMINFVSGKDLMPYNQESFRLKYTSILPTRQFFRVI